MHDQIPAGVHQYVQIIKGLHERWTPHEGQIRVGAALLRDNIKEVFVQAGRNWGKTETVAYLLWRWAMMNPGSENYYFAPFQKQSREIIWASRRLQNFGPKHWLRGENAVELRLSFNNGSFIKCDGSDNVESYRGVKPRGLTVFDEFKDFRSEFYEAYDPNRAAHDSPLLIIGTPPDRICQFTEVAEQHKASPDKAFFWAPTEENPHISREWLRKKKAELIARDEQDVWEREYMARFVRGGKKRIFPMLSESIVTPHEKLVQTLHRDRKKLVWVSWSDPAAATCFGTLFVAQNPYTRKLYFLDEIYETDQAKMSVKQIGRRILSTQEELWSRGEWRMGYDEAETWFQSEMFDHFNAYLEPSRKAASDKESGLSIIRDLLNNNLIEMSDRCQKLYWELDNYYKDDNGRIPKKNDHLIDCLRYILSALNYDFKKEEEYIETKNEDWRGARIEHDFPHLYNQDEFGEGSDYG